VSPLISVSQLVHLLDAETPALLDVRWRLGGPPGREEFLAGHIPGASYVDLESELADPPGERGRHPLPDVGRFTEAMRRAGVSDGRPVVVYDDVAATSAARCWWLLRYFGHDHVRVLDGGYTRWVADGGGVEQGEPRVRRGDFTAVPGHMPVLDAEGAERVGRTGVLIDARASERYLGDNEPVDPVAGHIPGAVNVPTSDNIVPPGSERAGEFKSADELSRSYTEVGVGSAAEVGVYCGSGVTAAHDVLALEVLGVSAALYPGSWSEWITDPARPVARRT
jgi:thiosulfate/3-mercaptopyruvate sulfurtransferase